MLQIQPSVKIRQPSLIYVGWNEYRQMFFSRNRAQTRGPSGSGKTDFGDPRLDIFLVPPSGKNSA